MDDRSLARRVVERARASGYASPPSTREITVDDRYARLLAEDLGVKETTARTAFIGEPQRRALGVVAWAMKHAPDDADKRAKMILAWAKKRRAGAFREDDGQDESLSGILDQYGERQRVERLAKSLARMWCEHPESLAEAIGALEQQTRSARNGRS